MADPASTGGMLAGARGKPSPQPARRGKWDQQQVNPATRQRGRGRKASQDRARATAEKIWAAEDDALLLAERCGLLAGEAEFIRALVMAFTGLQWGETVGLQASYI